MSKSEFIDDATFNLLSQEEQQRVIEAEKQFAENYLNSNDNDKNTPISSIFYSTK